MLKKLRTIVFRLKVIISMAKMEHFLNENKQYIPKNKAGCTLSLDAEEKCKKEQLEEEVTDILKKLNIDKNAIINYLQGQGVKVYKIANSSKFLKFLGEQSPLVISSDWCESFLINLILNKRIGFTVDPFFVVDKDNQDMYSFIAAFYKWKAMKKGFDGYDRISQKLLKRMCNSQGKSMKTFSIKDIFLLKIAMANESSSWAFSVSFSEKYILGATVLEQINNSDRVVV